MSTTTCKDVCEMIEKLSNDLRENPESWENPTLERYLEAMGAWLEAWDRKHHPEPSWELIKEMLEAAKIYE